MAEENEGMAGNGERIAARAVKRFFAETFRSHAKNEYGEVFTRGMTKKKGVNTVYPWLYMRLFVILFVVFSVFLIAMYGLGNILMYPSVVLFGGLTFTLPFMLLIYELYPGKDLSLVKLVGVIVIGGFLSIILSLAVYYVLPEGSGWTEALRVGCVEEFSKAVVAILIFISFKKKNPFLGFIIGAAVGAGFSIIEDMGYIYAYSDGALYISASSVVELFVCRGLSTFCTHILWTGFITWAYARRGSVLNWALTFMGCAVFSIALHMLWDAPVSGFPGDALLVVYGIVGGAVAIIMVWSEWKKAGIQRDGISRQPFESPFCSSRRISPRRLHPGPGKPKSEEFPSPRDGAVRNGAPRNGSATRPYCRQGRNISICIAFLLVCICALVYIYLPVYVGYGMLSFSDPERFTDYAQCGYDLQSDWEREYDERIGADGKIEADGELVLVTQKEFAVSETYEDVEYTYTYCYIVEDGSYFLTYVFADVVDCGETFRCACETISWQGDVYFSYFAVNEFISGVIVDDVGTIIVSLYDDSFVYGDDYYFPNGGMIPIVVAVSVVVGEVVVLISLFSVDRGKRRVDAERH